VDADFDAGEWGNDFIAVGVVHVVWCMWCGVILSSCCTASVCIA
jgi:hypothetical protein